MNVAFYATITQIEKIGSEIYSIERIKYLNSISNNKRRTQSKCAWILLQQICEKYNLLVNDFYTKNGKWYFKNSNLNFSISHCDNFVAVAISDSNKISIDIEKISDKTTIIVKKYLDKKGIKYNNKRSDYFYAKKWTSLECKFKEPTLSGVFSCKKVHNNGEYLINTYCDKKIKIYKWK